MLIAVKFLTYLVKYLSLFIVLCACDTHTLFEVTTADWWNVITCVNELMNVWRDDEWMDGWMNEWLD